MRWLVVLALCSGCVAPSIAADDPFACFGAARYLAMREGFSCADLPAFCAGAREILAEAKGDEAAADRLARQRGHGRLSILLAHRLCRRGA